MYFCDEALAETTVEREKKKLCTFRKRSIELQEIDWNYFVREQTPKRIIFFTFFNKTTSYIWFDLVNKPIRFRFACIFWFQCILIELDSMQHLSTLAQEWLTGRWSGSEYEFSSSAALRCFIRRIFFFPHLSLSLFLTHYSIFFQHKILNFNSFNFLIFDSLQFISRIN